MLNNEQKAYQTFSPPLIKSVTPLEVSSIHSQHNEEIKYSHAFDTDYSDEKIFSETDRLKISANEYENTSNIPSESRPKCFFIPIQFLCENYACMKYRPKLWHLINISILLQLLSLTTLILTFSYNLPMIDIIFNSVIWTLQLLTIMQMYVLLSYSNFEQLYKMKITQACALYLVSILIFANAYLLIAQWNPSQAFASLAYSPFMKPRNTANLSHHVQPLKTSNIQYILQLFVIFLYYSTSQQTLAGVSDTKPVYIPTVMISALQLFVGILLSIFIIAFTLNNKEKNMNNYHLKVVRGLFMLPTPSDSTTIRNARRLEAKNKNICQRMCDCCKSKFQVLTHNHVVKYIRRTLRRYLILFTLFIQSVKIIAHFLIGFKDQYGNNIALIIGTVLDALQIMLILTVSLKFVLNSKYNNFLSISMSFLIQSYLSCILLFVGLYIDVQYYFYTRYNFNTFVFLHAEGNFYENEMQMMLELMYFSVSTMTLSGTDIIQPSSWYTLALACIQMISGLFFHVIIFGFGLRKMQDKISGKLPFLL